MLVNKKLAASGFLKTMADSIKKTGEPAASSGEAPAMEAAMPAPLSSNTDGA